MSGSTHGSKSWYERSENEAYENPNAYYPKTSGWQTETECEDTASQYSLDSNSGRNHPLHPTIGQRVSAIFKKNIFTDVNFVISCGVKPKPSLRAHRAILAVGSPVFQDMLTKQEAANQDLIQINNTPFHAFRSVVEYLYTDEVYFERGQDSQVMEVMAAAKAFQVPALESRCISYMESSEVTEANVCTRLQLATAQKLEEYKKHCLQFIQDHTSTVIRSPDFKSSELSTVRNICKLPKLYLSSEMELFEGVMEWVKAQPQSHTKSKRELLDPLLRHIRFLSMSALDFSRLVSTYPDIFTAEEALSVIVYLSKPAARGKSNLPLWCSKGSNRCTSSRGAGYNPPNRNIHSKDRRLSICLRPIKKGQAPMLMCELALKCIEGSHKIKALKLCFGQPVTSESTIEELVITVHSEPSYYSFKEHHTRIRNASEITVPFTQILLARRGNVIHIRVEASSVKNYHFLQFDEQNSFLESSPFECRLNSEPKGRKLFFISEVIFEDLPQRQRPPKKYYAQR